MTLNATGVPTSDLGSDEYRGAAAESSTGDHGDSERI